MPADTLVTDPDLMESYRRDRSPLEGGRPMALARPTSTEEVALLLRTASRLGIPVVPRGAGSGLSGGATALDGCIVLSLARMDRILERDPVNAIAVVQPGVLNGALKFVFDIWGDPVNTASRMESHGVPGRIHLSDATYELIRDEFDCEPRGTIDVKRERSDAHVVPHRGRSDR